MSTSAFKSGLVFNKINGTLVGFIDLGGVNRDIEMLGMLFLAKYIPGIVCI